MRNALTMCSKRSCTRQRKTNNQSHKQQMITFNSPCSLWLSWVGSWRCPPVETGSSGGCGAPWTQCNVCIHSTRCPGYGCRPEDKKDTFSSSSSSSLEEEEQAAVACRDFTKSLIAQISIQMQHCRDKLSACILSYSSKPAPRLRLPMRSRLNQDSVISHSNG